MKLHFIALPLSLMLWGCGSQTEIKVPKTVVTASCGFCQLKMETPGCYRAVVIDEKAYPVVGVPALDMATMHQPGGYCVTLREATVEGTVKDDRFYADSYELIPLESAPQPLPANH